MAENSFLLKSTGILIQIKSASSPLILMGDMQMFLKIDEKEIQFSPENLKRSSGDGCIVWLGGGFRSYSASCQGDGWVPDDVAD